ncbi:MAG: hypothetical protein DRQ78_04515 [Epsilonproteobacteria bacterium]|nr:MAG: hypothetical protein DRQ78_04515 [Campylobacterota bacterium]
MQKTLFISIFILSPILLFALPKSILADKYLVGAKSSIDKQDYQAASEYFQKIVDLDVSLPDDFYFQYGKNALAIKDYEKALTYINLYLEKAGNVGKYYRDALLMSNQAEEAIIKKTEKQEQWDKYRAREEEKRKVEAAIARYTLDISTTPSNARIYLKYINKTYRKGMKLKEGKYAIKVSKKGYTSKEFSIYLNKDTKKKVTLKKIIKKSTQVWHCSAKSERASGWAEALGLNAAKKKALKQCNIRRQTSSSCRISKCYKVR